VTDLLHSHLLWYLNRSTGVVLVAVLTFSTALGVLSASGAGSRWPRFARQALHRNVSVLACALLVAHAVTPVLDTYVNHYVPISWVDTVVPFVSAYQPLATGLGTLSLDLLVVVVFSTVARRRFGHRAWFSLHLLSYAAWALGIVHGFVEGTDARTTWGLGVTAGALLVVTAALVARPGGHRPAGQVPGERATPSDPAAGGAPDRLLGVPDRLLGGSDRSPSAQDSSPMVPRPGVNPVSGPLTVPGPDTRRGRRAAGRRSSV
jgi:DMSO/TMAO reductase YedYZ heme-binding membrane subunit